MEKQARKGCKKTAEMLVNWLFYAKFWLGLKLRLFGLIYAEPPL